MKLKYRIKGNTIISINGMNPLTYWIFQYYCPVIRRRFEIAGPVLNLGQF